MNIQNDFSLKKFNTFEIDAYAKHLVKIDTSEEIEKFINSNQYKNEKVLVLGGGSNILFTKDFDGIVFKVNIKGIHVVKEDAHHFWVKAGAGVVWHELVENCIKANIVEENAENAFKVELAESAEEEEIMKTPSAIDRSVEPPFGPDPVFNAPEVWKSSLSNGISIMGNSVYVLLSAPCKILKLISRF